MTQVSALTWRRYRAFKERRTVSIAPVTIIIGRNGSGKSVLSRLPLLLASAISKQPNGHLDLTAGGVDHAGSFRDLVNMRGALPFSMGAKVNFKDEVYEFEATLRYIAETYSLAIEQFDLKWQGIEKFHAEIADVDQITSSNPVYNVRDEAGNRTGIPLRFCGLFPCSAPTELDSHIGSIHNIFQECFPMPSYLGPFRAEPARFLRLPSQSISTLGPRGERALELLADDRLRHGGRLTNEVNNWFASAMGHGIEVDVSSEEPRIFVKDIVAGLTVSLADTGAGFSQALPFVVQHFAHRIGRLRSTLLIVEQPELHLHPAAHGSLADLIIDSTSSGRGYPTMNSITETHSEQFIMRVRRRIAEGLDPKRVTLWSLNHRDAPEQEPEALRVITFDRAGNPNSWPIGVFEEALDDLTQMRKAGRARDL